MADNDQEDELVDIDGSRFVVTKNDEGQDIAVPIDDNYALAEIKKADAKIVAERERTVRDLQIHKTHRLSDVGVTVIDLAIIASCAFT